MYKLMIVDDEEIIRTSLSTCIDWASYDITVCAVCKNGVEAYEAILDEYPDIVITDIEMPGYSGLELIYWVQKSNISTQFIILSGYSDFSYAQQAMKMGVTEYLLKPCQNKQLLESISVLSNKIDTYRKSTKASVSNPANRLRYQTINHIISECVSSPQTLPTMQYAFEYVDFHTKPYYMVKIHNMIDSELTQCLQVLYNHRDKAAAETYIHLLLIRNSLVLLFEVTSSSIALFETAKQELSSLLHSVEFEANRFPSLIEALDILYETCAYSIHSKIIYGYNLVSLSTDSSWSRRFIVAKEGFNGKNISQQQVLMDNLMDNLIRTTPSYLIPIQIKNLILDLSYSFGAESFSASLIRELSSPSTLSDNEKLKSLLIDLFTSFQAPTSYSDPSYKPFITRILEYIDQNLEDSQLTLKQIADTQLFMNVNYLSQQFLKQTGVKFSTYLNQKRIEMAQALLSEDENTTVFAVAERVGCGNNPQYFSQLFKKYTGMTPTKYQQKAFPSKKS